MFKMINYEEFYSLLYENEMISPIWQHVLKMLKSSYNDTVLKILSLYFSLIDDGNVTMSLDKDDFLNKLMAKVESTKIYLLDKESFDEKSLDEINNEIQSLSNSLDELKDICNKDNSIFVVEGKYFYAKKYFDARKSISNSIDRLFSVSKGNKISNYKDYIKNDFELSNGQLMVVEKGFANNIIITGGPGTGKTTSILFLLLDILQSNDDYEVYLTAPSGKAASRMKESINKSIDLLKDEYLDKNDKLINRIKELQGLTIHRLLGSREGEDYIHNENNQFSEKSIFIIDEASMIDICLFSSLLSSIPTNARVFIMGDKNQLPSVGCGAVFSDLLKIESNVVVLDESKRFNKDTKIFKLASEINEGKNLSISLDDWKDYKEFKIEEYDKSKPIFYYKNEGYEINEEKNLCEFIINTWGKRFYKDIQLRAANIKTDKESLDNVYSIIDEAKILTAENDGIRGSKNFNKLIKSKFFNKGIETSVAGHYSGEIMMINKNNNSLDLYNGDTGILVTFEDDNVLYFMIKKSIEWLSRDGKESDKIFKLGDYMFYPLRMIASSEIDLAYAITIHKSQGSDYNSILVFLPTRIGHPLLNRQIVYTAITRTKGNTYIVSSKKILDEAKNTIYTRDTNIEIKNKTLE